ncbi:protein-disulfide reductase DsbD family protein [Frigoriglobus tundricola]|uniref:Cytochrome c-type biogenesis protein DsbD, protein-disulfide reductase n=1 Tax=Frigoriglobus tundricola TaxID=2774151 RepID=A0A6M5YRS1_9BACT|nr:thioredoxin family protein [Frigoriglobus tundricola]QJW95672.1 Cytochrome c-type biogenesis protein DsbD, protein-disulfide reductase [Frigoriglobus tundricola]
MMSRSALVLVAFALCGLSAPVSAQPLGDPFPKDGFAPPAGKLPAKFAKLADVSVSVTPAKVKAGETVTVRLTVAPKAGGYTYPAAPEDAKQTSRNEIELPAPGDLIFIDPVTDPALKWETKPRDADAPNGPKDQYTHQAVTWAFKAVVSPKAKSGAKSIPLDGVRLQVCDAKNCYIVGGEKLPPVEFRVEEGTSDKVNPDDLKRAQAIVNGPPPANAGPGQVEPPPASGSPVKTESRKTAKSTEAYADELKTLGTAIVPADEAGTKQTGLWGFIATAALWGLISLVTPCVFPMIPITVSIFLKQAHGSLRERLKLAGVYSLTIISVLGVSAFALLKFMAVLSTDPVTNILLGVLFLVLALSLFGMFELGLPNVLQKRLQAKQSQGGVVGTIFGALAFTVISFTCVAPFLGGFAGISAGSDGSGGDIVLPTAREIAGGLAFATAFAAPFFVLALVPGLMKALPRSGGWLDNVKVVMGFLELAAALKFLRTAELRLLPATQYFTYDLVLSGWVAISGACGLYLLNVFRLPHDEERPNIGVPRLLFALLFIGLALYLAPALLKGADGKGQRPAGAVYAWVEAFLLPEDAPVLGAKQEDVWRTDLKDALDAARKSGRPVFLDFTGVTCTNCKINERDVFPQSAIREDLQQFEKVKLYTDEVPAALYGTDPGRQVRKAEAKANGEFQNSVFKDIALPMYVVLVPQPDGAVKVLGLTEGKINDTGDFSKFLKDSLEKAKSKK